MNKNKWFLNGGRGSGRTYRLLFEYYEKKVAELKRACDKTQELLDKQIEATHKLDVENAELKEWYHESDEDNNKLRENIPILAEAKEIIKTFLSIANNDVEYVQNSKDCKDFWKELCEKAEQFIKDSEVGKC